MADVRHALHHLAVGTADATASIAVLPFANLSADRENEYFGDGLAEEIINALAQVEGLKVIARTTELVEPRRRNWGDNLTLVGAMRVDRWLTLSTAWGAMTTPRFVDWVHRRLVPRLRRGDIVVLDNLAAHKAGRVRTLVEQAGRHPSLLAALLARLQSHRSGAGTDQEAHSHRSASHQHGAPNDRSTSRSRCTPAPL